MVHWKSCAITQWVPLEEQVSAATESHSSGRGTAAALDFLGILSTYPQFTPTCRHIMPPNPHKRGHWHCDTRRLRSRGQRSDHRSGLPSCDQSGATSLRDTLWRKVREDLAPGITGGWAEDAGGEAGRSWEKGRKDLIAALHCLKATMEKNKIHSTPWKDNTEQTQAARWEIPIKHEEKKILWWDCLSTGTGCSERLWKCHSLQVHPEVCTCITPQLDKALSDLIYLSQPPLFRKEADTRNHFKPKFLYYFYDATNTD